MRVTSASIALVEDEALIAFLIQDELEAAGCEVVWLPNGDDALRVFESEVDRFDAIITDIKMPGSADGWCVGKRVRELRPDMPVIYASGDSAENWRKFGVPNSVMLAKPFQVEVALELLRKLVPKMCAL